MDDLGVRASANGEPYPISEEEAASLGEKLYWAAARGEVSRVVELLRQSVGTPIAAHALPHRAACGPDAPRGLPRSR